MDVTVIQAPVTETGAFTTSPDIDISGITTDWEIHLKVLSFSANAGVTPVARFAFSDSVNSFSASLAGPVAHVSGPISDGSTASSSAAPQEFVFKKRDYPGMRFGTTSALLRLLLASVTGAGASINYTAWIVS